MAPGRWPRRYRGVVRRIPPRSGSPRADHGTDRQVHRRFASVSIGIVGLGYVGLPLAVGLAEAGQGVVGGGGGHGKGTAPRGGGSYIRGGTSPRPRGGG